MKKRSLVLIAGWAHTEHALHPIASALHAAAYDLKVRSTWKLLREEDFVRRAACKENSGLSGYAKELKQILEKQDIPSIVIGWSAGGMVALEVACENPELLERLVLIGATARLCADDGYPCGVAVRNVR
ncbi:MAG: alpha/beta fold hydrolase, partial [Desulfobacterales bacterium]|nr:alpha/beta fold hydrolase [Desulfobacterales bacterium]